MEHPSQLTREPDGALRVSVTTRIESALAVPGMLSLLFMLGGGCSMIFDGTSFLIPLMGLALFAATAYLHGKNEGDHLIDPASRNILRARGTNRTPIARFEDIALVTLGSRVTATRSRWYTEWGILAVGRDGSTLWLSDTRYIPLEDATLNRDAQTVAEALGVPLIPARPDAVVATSGPVAGPHDLSYRSIASQKVRYVAIQLALIFLAMGLVLTIGWVIAS